MQRGPASSSQCQHYQSTRPGRTNRHPGIQSQNTHTHKKKRENSLDTQTERSKPHTQIKLKTKRVEGRNGNNGEYASVIAQDNESKRTRASEGKQEVKSNSKQPKFQPSLTTSKHRQPATTQRATAEVKKKKMKGSEHHPRNQRKSAICAWRGRVPLEAASSLAAAPLVLCRHAWWQGQAQSCECLPQTQACSVFPAGSTVAG